MRDKAVLPTVIFNGNCKASYGVLMSKMRGLLSRLHWRWILPTLLTVVTAVLMVGASIQYSQPNHPPNLFTPTHIIAELLSGPAFYPFLRVPIRPLVYDERFLIDLGSLPAVALLWFCLGLGLERKLRGRSEWLISRKPTRVIVFSILLMVELFFLYTGIWWLHFHASLPFQAVFRSALRISWWWIPESHAYAMSLWALIGTGYFGTKLWGTCRMQLR